MSWPVTSGNYKLGNGYIAIICLGEKYEDLPEELFKSKIKIIGSLITPNLGIEKVVLNIATCPDIQYVIVYGKDIEGFWPGDAIVCLWKYGVDENGKIINAKSELAKINLPNEYIEAFRSRKLIDLRNSNKEKLIEVINSLKPIEKEIKFVKNYKKENISYLTFSNFSIGHIIRAKNPIDAWYLVLKEVWFYGNLVDTHFGKTKELILLITVIENPSFENLPKHLPFDKNYLNNYLKSFLENYNPGYEYTYGERINGYNQVEKVINAFKTDYTTRQAVISVFWPSDHNLKDKPCLSLIQFFIRNNALHCISYWRSHDVYGAIFANWYGLYHLQKRIAESLNVKIGNLVTISSSAHIYERDFEKVEKIIKDVFKINENRIVEAKKISEFGYHGKDPKGYFVVENYDEELIVSKFDIKNNLIYSVKGKDEESIRHTIALLDPSLYPESYLWLGKEIGKKKK